MYRRKPRLGSDEKRDYFISYRSRSLLGAGICGAISASCLLYGLMTGALGRMLVPMIVGLAATLVPMTLAVNQVVEVGIRDRRPAPTFFDTKGPTLSAYSPGQRAFQAVAVAITVLVVTQPVEFIAFAAGGWAGFGLAYSGLARTISRTEVREGHSYWIRERWWNEFSAGEPQQEYLYFSPRQE